MCVLNRSINIVLDWVSFEGGKGGVVWVCYVLVCILCEVRFKVGLGIFIYLFYLGGWGIYGCGCVMLWFELEIKMVWFGRLCIYYLDIVVCDFGRWRWGGRWCCLGCLGFDCYGLIGDRWVLGVIFFGGEFCLCGIFVCNSDLVFRLFIFW